MVGSKYFTSLWLVFFSLCIKGIYAQTITTGTISPTTFCSGEEVSVPYTAVGVFSSDNIFLAQLSDSSGSFANPVVIGMLTSTTSDTITARIPHETPTGTGYRIRVVSTSLYILATDNGTDLTINTSPSAAAAGYDQYLCTTTSTYMTATAPLVGSGNWSVVSGSATIANPSSPTSMITGLAPAPSTAVLRWTTTNGSCTSYDDVVINVLANTGTDGSLDCSFNDGDFGNGVGMGANNNIHTIALQPDGKIVIGGFFSAYNGTINVRIARLNTDGTLDANFNSGTGASTTIRTSALQRDGKIIIGGDFTSYNGTGRNRIARLNTDGSLDASFNPGTGANDIIWAISIQPDGKIIIGGDFTTYNGTGRNRIARLNADGTLDSSFDPGTGANDRIWATLLQTDGKIIIGGNFTSYNSTGRNRIARLNADGTLDASFNIGTGANNSVRSITIQPDGKIIVGGNFTNYNGTSRNYIARLNTSGTLDASFNPGTGASNFVRTITLQPDGKIIIGGDFSSYDGTGRNRVARLNTDGTLDTSFDPGTGFNNIVYATVLRSDGKIIVGGGFTSYNGTGINRLSRLNTDGALDADFNLGTGANSSINTTALQPDGKILIGGDFTSFNGTGRNRIARLNADGTLDVSFNPGTGSDNEVRAITLQPDGKIIIGGDFTAYNGTGRNRIARLNADGTLDATFNPGTGANSIVYVAAVQPDGKIIIGGAFTTYNGTGRNRIARLNADGTLDASFDPGTGASSFIRTIALQPDGKIIIGGDFTSYNGTGRNYIARLNSDGTLDASFNPGSGTSGSIYATALQPDGRIIIGGFFSSYNSISRSRIARINTDGTLDASFNPASGANNSINTLAVQPDGKILIGGGFTSYGGSGRNRIARVNPDGSLDATFNPGTGAPNIVETITIQNDEKIIIGGSFTNYNGAGRNSLARVYSSVATITTSAITPTAICAGSTVSVPYTVTGTFTAGNIFFAQLSDSSGSFASPIIIGMLPSDSSGTISATIPANTPPGSGYRIRVVSTAPPINGSDNGTNLTINAAPSAATAGYDQYLCTTTSTYMTASAPLVGTGSWSVVSGSATIVSPSSPTTSVTGLAAAPSTAVLRWTTTNGSCTSTDDVTINVLANTGADGSLDCSFNDGDFGYGIGTGARNGVIYTTALQPDGKIIIGGNFTSYNGVGRVSIARVNVDGTLDASFNPGTGANGIIYSAILQPDGKIIITGDFTTYNGTGRNRIARINNDGTLDASFNPGSGASATIRTSLFLTNGKILIGGDFTTYNGTGRNRIALVNTNGTIDLSFTPGTGADGTINAMALQPDGKIIIAGNFITYNGTGRNRIARINQDGSLDAGFNPGTGANNTVWSASLQSDGKIIIGGNFTSYNGTSINRIARINLDGSMDVSFNPGSGSTNIIQTVVIQPDGKVLIGGDFTSYNGTGRNRIARVNEDGSLDIGFNPGTGANSSIFAISLQTNGKVVIGGSFTNYNGKEILDLTRLNADGTKDASFNEGTGANGYVLAAAVQTDGKIIIAGDFTSYNGTVVNRIARLNSNGTLDTTFNPGTGANQVIRRLALQPDGKIIIVGSFTSYNGASRNRIARLNTNGTLDASFNPGTGANLNIYAVALQPDGKMMIGGVFSSYNGTGRNYIARVNADGTLDASFNPGTGANGSIYTIAIQPDGKILIGGNFTTYNGTGRNRVARINSDGTLDTGFNPGSGANNEVEHVSIQPDGKVIIVGNFTTYGGTGRNRIARVNSNGTLDASFNPGTGTNDEITYSAIQPDGKIIIGGWFTTYNGTGRNRIARINTNGSLDASFDPGTGTDNVVHYAALQQDGKIVIGGYFENYNGAGRNYVARIHGFSAPTITTSSIAPTSYCAPVAVSVSYTITGTFATGNTFIAQLSDSGGSFSSPLNIGSLVSTSSGTISAYIPHNILNGTSYRIRVISSTGVLGTDNGSNLTINPIPTAAAAGYDQYLCTTTSTYMTATTPLVGSGSWSVVSGSATIANPSSPTSMITGLAPAPSTAVLRWTTTNGSCTSYDDVVINVLANTGTDGSLDCSFNDGDLGFGATRGANNVIYSIALQPDGKIIVGGDFSLFHGTSKGRITRLNVDGSIDNTFDVGTGTNGSVNTISLQPNGKIIIAGNFTSYNGTGRTRIARLNDDGSIDASFNPGSGANNLIYKTALQNDGKILIAGAFTNYNGTGRNRLARVNPDGTLDLSFSPGTGANNVVYTIAIQTDGKVIIGGWFTSYNGTGRNRIARVNTDGTLDASFNPGSGANDNVYSAAIQSDGRIIIGGDFTTYNGTGRNRIARLNADGSLDVSFDPLSGANGSVEVISLQPDGKPVIVGGFTIFGGMGRNYIARLNSNGTLDVSFNPGAGANSFILTAALQTNGSIIVGGNFTSYDGLIRNYIARLNNVGTPDASFNPGTGASSSVYSSALQSDGKIIIGGNFTSFNGIGRNRIARLNTDGTLDTSFDPGTGTNGSVYAVVLQPDGKIILGGDFSLYNGTGRNFIVRINADGTLDASFNPGSGADGIIYAFAIQPDNKIIIGGSFSTYNGTGRNCIARLNTDGTLDASFNPGSGANNVVRTLALQPDGKIIIGGDFTSYNGTGRNRIARLNADGSLDASFNPGTGANNTIYTTALQPDGKIIIGGSFTSYNGTGRNRIARLNADGTLDASFNPGTGASDAIETIAMQPDEKIIIGGWFTSYNGAGRNHLARVYSSVCSIGVPTLSLSSYCKGEYVTVTYTTTGTFNSGNTFTAQLSDSTGSFASPVSIGSVAALTASPINAIIPEGADAATGYRIRVVSSDIALNGPDNGTNLTVLPTCDYYWVGGAGNWNNATHWSKTSGGTGGVGIPNISINVNIDDNSGTGATVPITITPGIWYTKQFNMTGVNGKQTPIIGSGTLLPRP